MLVARELWARRALLAAAAACIGTTCHAPVGFEIRGDLESGVVIRMADLTANNGTVTVEEVVVGQVGGQELWRLEGHARVELLVYGEPQDGLSVKVGPSPLQPDRAYYIVVIGDAAWGRDAKGTCSFGIDTAGRVQAEPGC